MTDDTVFVKIDEYEKILAKISTLNDHIKKAKGQLKLIQELKVEEDKNLVEWEGELANMEEKIGFVTNTMSQRE